MNASAKEATAGRSESTAIDRLDAAAILRILTDIVATQLTVKVAREQIRADASLEDELGVDSVALIELIGLIEDRFRFAFSDSDLRPSSFRSLGALARLIAARLGAQTKASP
jgi:acyl carrier protein